MILRAASIVLAGMLIAAPAAAQQQTAAPVEVDIKAALSGRFPAGSTITQQGPFTVVSIPIPEDQLPILRATAGFGLDDDDDVIRADDEIAAKPFALAVGASLLTPSMRNGITINDVSPLKFTDYFYYWVSANFSSNTVTKNTKFRLRGPGVGFVLSEPLDYEGASLVLFFLPSDPAIIAGIYKLDVKIKGSPKVKALVCVGC